MDTSRTAVTSLSMRPSFATSAVGLPLSSAGSAPPPQKRRAASHEWTGYPVFPSRMPPRSAVVVGAVGGILGARRLLSVLARRGVLPRIDVQVAIDVDAVTRCSVDGAIVLCSVVSVSPQGEPLPRVLELSQPCKATDSTHRL